MHYELDHDQCAQLLRMVLPQLSTHGLCVNPVTYAVWFEYLGGFSPRLKAALDKRIAQGEKLDQTCMDSLYAEHILGTGGNRLEHIKSEVLQLLQQVKDCIGIADDRFKAYEDRLIQVRRTLEVASFGQLAELVTTLSAVTGDLRSENTILKQELLDHGKEVENLSDELQRARHQAVTDPLTGISNRTGLLQAANDALTVAHSDGAQIALVLLDIDHFKHVNDVNGRLMGDRVIKAVAKVLGETIKGRDTAARYGGEEFAVLLPKTALEGAHAVAESIRAGVERIRIRRPGTQVCIDPVSVSAGVAVLGDAESFESLTQRAVAALHAAKRAGRNRVCDAGASGR